MSDNPVRVSQPAEPELYKTYSGYTEALADCSNGAYENPDLVDFIYRRTKLALEQLDKGAWPIDNIAGFCAVALLQIVHPGAALSVLDVGGACGAHYHSARIMLPSNVRLRWCVVETPAMAAQAAEFATDELSFFDSIDAAERAAGSFDLVFTSGTLQHVDKPYEMLDRILALGARFMMFARGGFTSAPTDLTIVHSSNLWSNGRGPIPSDAPNHEIRYPFIFLSIGKFLSRVTANYEVLLQLEDESGSSPVNQEPTFGAGLLLRKRL